MSTTSKAMTLQEAKDKVAKKYNHVDWESLTKNTGCNYRMDKMAEAAELYASSQNEALKEINKELVYHSIRSRKFISAVQCHLGKDGIEKDAITKESFALISKAKELANKQ